MKKLQTTKVPVYLKQTNQFRTIGMRFVFMMDATIEARFLVELLAQYLVRTNQFYPTKSDLVKRSMELFDSHFSVSFFDFGKKLSIEMEFVMVDPTYLGEDYLEDAFEFFMQLVFSPYIIDGQFDEETVERIKKYICSSSTNALTSISYYTKKKLTNLVASDSNLNWYIQDHWDEITHITGKKLYAFYQKMIQQVGARLFVMGNLAEDQIVSLVEAYTPNLSVQSIDRDYNCWLYGDTKRVPHFYREVASFHQSCLAVCLKVDQITEQDQIVLLCLTQLLSSSVSNLFEKELRGTRNLVYYTEVFYGSRYGLFYLLAFLKRGNQAQAMKGVYSVLTQLQNQELVSSLLDQLILLKEDVRKRAQDQPSSLFDEMCVEVYGYGYTKVQYLEALRKVTAKDIAAMVDRLILDTVYFVEGDR